jgi:hypothetical protein
MPVAENDQLNIAQRKAQPAHVLDDAGWGDAGVE